LKKSVGVRRTLGVAQGKALHSRLPDRASCLPSFWLLRECACSVLSLATAHGWGGPDREAHGPRVNQPLLSWLPRAPILPPSNNSLARLSTTTRSSLLAPLPPAPPRKPSRAPRSRAPPSDRGGTASPPPIPSPPSPPPPHARAPERARARGP
jgi:hypothetical protein